MFVCVVFTIVTVVFASAWQGMAPLVQLNTGYMMPVIAQGTNLTIPPGLDNATYNVEKVTQGALEYGFRHIDTARDYGVEYQIGRALKTIMKKLKETENNIDSVFEAVEDSIANLQLEYLDLVLMYRPNRSNVGDVDLYLWGWEGLMEAQEEGLVRTIGMCNVNLETLRSVKEKGYPLPSVLQIDVSSVNLQDDAWSLKHQQRRLVRYCKKNNITVMGFEPIRPLYQPRRPNPRFDDPVLERMAKKYKKSVIQIVLKFAIEEGIVPVQSSYTLLRIFRNIHIFGFKLEKA